MKKKFYQFVLLALLILPCSSIFAYTQNPEVIHFALNMDPMEKNYQKDIYGEYLPIYLVSNGLVDESNELTFKSYPINIIAQASELPKGEDISVIELQSMKVKSKKASLSLSSGDKNIKIKLKKKEGKWTYSHMVSKSKSSMEVDF